MHRSRTKRVPAARPTAHRPLNEPVPMQRCFPWEAPGIPGLPPSPSRDRLSLNADVQESLSETALWLERLGASIHTRPLRCSYGMGAFGIQKNTMGELASSSGNTSIFLRSILTAQAFSYRLLICEGFRDSAPARTLWEKTARVTLAARVPALVTPGPVETARLLLWIGSAVTDTRRRRSIRGAKASGKHDRSSHISLLQGIPGVGPSLAKQIWQRYGSVGII